MAKKEKTQPAASFFAKRAGARKGTGLVKFLKKAPKRTPDKGDQIR